jgi:hypothetical protein
MNPCVAMIYTLYTIKISIIYKMSGSTKVDKIRPLQKLLFYTLGYKQNL